MSGIDPAAGLEPPLHPFTPARRLAAEALGTALLLAVVVGSGIMGQRLSAENDAVALLGNTTSTGAALVVLITVFGPISGAHFNPAVTLAFLVKREIGWRLALGYLVVQLAGAILGVWAAHLMFAQPVLQVSTHARSGPAQAFSEFVATFGLLATILGLPPLPRGLHPGGGGALHHLGLLVHRLHLLRQPGGDGGAQPVGHLRRHRPRRRARLHRRPGGGGAGGRGRVRLAAEGAAVDRLRLSSTRPRPARRSPPC